MAQQTAVEWFFDRLKNHEIQSEHYLLYVKARAMEKQQIKDAVIYGLDEDGHTGDWKISVAQNYYNEKHLGIKGLSD